MSDLDALKAENAKLRDDVAWLLAAQRGEPVLAEGETAHEWTFDLYADHFITDPKSDSGSALKLRRIHCDFCGQTWTHA